MELWKIPQWTRGREQEWIKPELGSYCNHPVIYLPDLCPGMAFVMYTVHPLSSANRHS
jgi:hypothetical protein